MGGYRAVLRNPAKGKRKRGMKGGRIKGEGGMVGTIGEREAKKGRAKLSRAENRLLGIQSSRAGPSRSRAEARERQTTRVQESQLTDKSFF